MRIPKVIGKEGRQYIFVKEYPNYYLYKDLMTETKECFTKFDLGMVKEIIPRTKNINPEKVKR